jgi:hypothetical protein
MMATPAFVSDFARLTAVTIESLVRLESSLTRQSLISKKPEYHAILTKMLEVCRSYKKVFFDHVDLFRSALDGKPQSALDELKIRQVLRHSAGAFLALHELALFLPRESIRHEMISYCECLFRKEFNLDRISIMLTSVFNAFEYSLDDVMRTLSIDVFKMKVPNPDDLPFGHVMELAVVDRDNPLSWAILAHEFGHYIDHSGGLSKTAAKDFVDSAFKSSATPNIQRTFERIGSEIVADLTAYHLLGPCSLAPVLSMSLLASQPLDRPIPFDNIHPVPATRFQLMDNLAVADKMNTDWIRPLEQALAAEEKQKEVNLTAQELKNRADVDSYIRYFCAQVQESVLQALGKKGFKKFDAQNFARSKKLAYSLQQGLPIGAAKTLSDDEIWQQLADCDLYEQNVDYDARFNILKDMPVNPGEVLTAGWHYKIEKTPAIIRAALAKDTEEKVFNEVKSFVENTDNLLLMSFEIILTLEKAHGTA